MHTSHPGEYAALLTALFWTITALAFESASKRIGSLAVNLLRLLIAIVFLGIYSYITRGMFFPTDASLHNWGWLALSGLIGFVIGDLALFQSFVLIGARVSMLIMSLVPPITALISWIFLNEKLSLLNFGGMLLIMSGIALVILGRSEQQEKSDSWFSVNYSLKGLFFAFLGALGQAVGLVMSKYGMGEYDAFASSQIRVLVGALGFVIMFFILGKWNLVGKAIKNRKAMSILLLGAFFGPFLGVSFSLLAVQNTAAGIASTLMSITPILIIPPAVILFKERLLVKEVIGALLAVGGVAVFFL
ncbi:MAG: DMT family transporter [Bacteroidota bacterium]